MNLQRLKVLADEGDEGARACLVREMKRRGRLRIGQEYVRLRRVSNGQICVITASFRVDRYGVAHIPMLGLLRTSLDELVFATYCRQHIDDMRHQRARDVDLCPACVIEAIKDKWHRETYVLWSRKH